MSERNFIPGAIRAGLVLAYGMFCGFGQAQSTDALPNLKDVFQKKFLVGAALKPAHVTGQDEGGIALVVKHFNTITPENAMKWEPIHPSPDIYDFDVADKYVEFGQKHGMKVIGHTLVWHQQTPRWVFRDGDKPADRELLLARMREHISKVVGRYKGKVAGWDVVNEAIDEDGKMRKSPWLEIIGPDYVEKAFQFAHEADPSAELYYNDYSLENRPKRRGAMDLVRDLKSKGVRIDGVGLQGHYKMDWPKPALVDDTIKDFAGLGLKCMITELDIDVLPSGRGASADISAREDGKSASNPYAAGLPENVSNELAKRYAELFRVFVKNERHIERVAFWGVTDGDSWLNYWPVRGRTNHPLLFDREGKPKKAFHAVVKVGKAS